MIHSITFEELQARPRRQYHVNGKRVGGVTTILGELDKGEYLKNWFCEQGGIEMRDRIVATLRKSTCAAADMADSIAGFAPNKKAARTVSGKAADIGTIAHWFCECHVRGDQFDVNKFPRDLREPAICAFDKFREFWDSGGWQLVDAEVELVHDPLRYGGTLDLIAQDRQMKLWLLDLKTSKAIYDEYPWQLAAYEQLWQYNKGHGFDGRMIVRIGKTDAEIELKQYDALDAELAVFNAALAVYWAKRGDPVQLPAPTANEPDEFAWLEPIPKLPTAQHHVDDDLEGLI